VLVGTAPKSRTDGHSLAAFEFLFRLHLRQDEHNEALRSAVPHRKFQMATGYLYLGAAISPAEVAFFQVQAGD
jgi:hypothetical protein